MMRTGNDVSNSNANNNEMHEGRGRKSRRRIYDIGIISSYPSVDLDHERRSKSRDRNRGSNSKRLVKAIKTLKCSVRANDDNQKFEYELEEARRINEAEHHKLRGKQPQQLQKADDGTVQFENFASFEGDTTFMMDLQQQQNTILTQNDNVELEIFTDDTKENEEDDDNDSKNKSSKSTNIVIVKEKKNIDDDNDIKQQQKAMIEYEAHATNTTITVATTTSIERREASNSIVLTNDLLSSEEAQDGLPASSTSKQMNHIIKQGFRQLSSDSNETPITCNKSLIVTPPITFTMNKVSSYDEDDNDEDAYNSNDSNDNEMRQILYRSLSLGDALTPNDDSPPCQMRSRKVIDITEVANDRTAKMTTMIKKNYSDDVRNHNGNNGHQDQQNCVSHRQQVEEMLQLPAILGNKTKTTTNDKSNFVHNYEKRRNFHKEKSVLRRWRFKTPSGCNKSNNNTPTASTKEEKDNNIPISTKIVRDDDSILLTSSTISSFVFPSNSSDHNKDKSIIGNFGKQENYNTKKVEVVISTILMPVRGFFWKTHPLLTLIDKKSDQYQQRSKEDTSRNEIAEGKETMSVSINSTENSYYRRHESAMEKEDNDDDTERVNTNFSPYLHPAVVQKMWMESQPFQLDVIINSHHQQQY